MMLSTKFFPQESRICHCLNEFLSPSNYRKSFKRSVTKVMKKDPDRHKKLPIFDYSRINLEKKRVYVIGGAFHGAVGLPDLLRPKKRFHEKHFYVARPVRHKFFYDFDLEDIAAGHGFSLFGVQKKSNFPSFVFGCGRNECSQLGYQVVRYGHPLEVLISPANISVPVKQEKPKILALAGGRGHSIISIKDEGLVTWGDNSKGQCGRYIDPNEKYFGSNVMHRIKSFAKNEDHEVISIASKFDVTVCITHAGRVVAFGDNSRGQLGRGKIVTKTWDTANTLDGDISGVKIVKVSTNGSSVLAVSDEGEIFGWGSNEMGEIDHSHKSQNFYEPRHIQLSHKIGKIVDASLGNDCSYVVNEEGNVYVWGQGPTLGLGPQTVRVVEPTIMPPPLFGRNDFNPDIKVTGIVGSIDHSAAINSAGDVFTWGNNDFGRLGLGKLKNMFFPLKVSLNAKALKVSLGVHHTLVLTQGGH